MENQLDSQHVQKISNLVTVTVKHDYSPEELAEQSQLLAKAVQDKAHAEAEKKIAVKEFTDKVALHEKEIKDFTNKVSNGHAYIDVPAEMFLDYQTEKRMYYDKRDGRLLKEENFHASDYQTKINFYEKQEQIQQNNEAGNFAENGGDALDGVIAGKKSSGKPTPKDNLHPDHGKNLEYPQDNLPEGLGRDRFGNPPDLFEKEDDGLPPAE